jgi:hypothetical protein
MSVTRLSFLIAADGSLLSNRRLPLPSPQTPMSAARKDPFASLALSLDNEGHELLDYYITVIPGLVFRADLRATYLLNPVRDVLFKEAMIDPLILQSSVLAFTAGYKARWYGFKETEQSRRLLNQAVHLAEKTAMLNSGQPTNGLIMGFTSLAHWEDRWGSSENSYNYLNRAQHLMKQRSDMSGPRPRLPCETWLHWLHFTLRPKPEPDGSISSPHPSLISCLWHLYHIMHFQREMAARIPNTRRLLLFEPGSALHQLLSAPAKIEHVPETQYIYSVIARMNLTFRIGSLLYIHVALWDYRESQEDTEEYLAMLEQTVKQHEIDRFPSTSLLLWVMLEAEDHPRLGNPARAWKVGEMLNEAKKLQRDQQERLGDFLLALLSMTDPPTNLPFWETEFAAS